MIERFVASPRWPRNSPTATAVHREVEFLLAWPPGETNGDGRYLQGFIDCLYQDAAGDWHLVDYKTNDVTAADVARVAQQYEMQLLRLRHGRRASARPAADRARAPLPPPRRRTRHSRGTTPPAAAPSK